MESALADEARQMNHDKRNRFHNCLVDCNADVDVRVAVHCVGSGQMTPTVGDPSGATALHVGRMITYRRAGRIGPHTHSQ
jgi:hypothetical protein